MQILVSIGQKMELLQLSPLNINAIVLQLLCTTLNGSLSIDSLQMNYYTPLCDEIMDTKITVTEVPNLQFFGSGQCNL